MNVVWILQETQAKSWLTTKSHPRVSQKKKKKNKSHPRRQETAKIWPGFLWQQSKRHTLTYSQLVTQDGSKEDHL
jgi:hypothetical protein